MSGSQGAYWWYHKLRVFEWLTAGPFTLWETGGFQKAWKQAVPLGHTDSTLKLQNTLNSALAKIQPVI